MLRKKECPNSRVFSYTQGVGCKKNGFSYKSHSKVMNLILVISYHYFKFETIIFHLLKQLSRSKFYARNICKEQATE